MSDLLNVVQITFMKQRLGLVVYTCVAADGRVRILFELRSISHSTNYLTVVNQRSLIRYTKSACYSYEKNFLLVTSLCFLMNGK